MASRVPSLRTKSVPSLAAMRRGEGIIRLRASTKHPERRVGPHRLAYSNTLTGPTLASIWLTRSFRPTNGFILRDSRETCCSENSLWTMRCRRSDEGTLVFLGCSSVSSTGRAGTLLPRSLGP